MTHGGAATIGAIKFHLNARKKTPGQSTMAFPSNTLVQKDLCLEMDLNTMSQILWCSLVRIGQNGTLLCNLTVFVRHLTIDISSIVDVLAPFYFYQKLLNAMILQWWKIMSWECSTGVATIHFQQQFSIGAATLDGATPQVVNLE